MNKFTDARGSIDNVVAEFNGDIIFIKSVAGAIRANHYHLQTGHWAYVTKGKIIYFERPVGSKEKPAMIEVMEGEKIWTPPMVEHVMLFDCDTDFICCSTGCRSKEDYEKDLIRLDFNLHEQ